MDRDVATHQLGIEGLTKRLGRPAVVYGALAFVACWIALNATMQLRGGHAFDPFPFFALQGLITLSAFTMTILILTAATRLGEIADQRARLALHINLVTEQKIAKAIEMLDLLRFDDPRLKERPDPVADVMAEPVNPTIITEALDNAG